MPKLLSERKKLCDKGKLKMCIAEYDGSWLPYMTIAPVKMRL
jgi:hypothetical protein